MKRIILTSAIAFISICGLAQKLNYVSQSYYQPMSIGEMMLKAQAEVYWQQVMQQKFEKYQEIAYDCFNKGNYYGFINYSSYALETGWYSSKLYYDRGVAFEYFHDYRKAKKEYKRAIKSGYYPAQTALEQCKIHQKEWNKSH